LLAVLGAALFVALLLPAAVAVAQEQYPPQQPPLEVQSAATVRHDPTTQSQLAFTGSSDTMPIVLIAGALVVFGGTLVVVARRRRTVTAD
jgi:LPXTG-motif cell wall-anchored protein